MNTRTEKLVVSSLLVCVLLFTILLFLNIFLILEIHTLEQSVSNFKQELIRVELDQIHDIFSSNEYGTVYMEQK